MEFTKLVEARRSIRAYEAGAEVKKADLEEMIKCAVMAPSWKNTETARYYVVESADAVAKVKAETLPAFNQNSSANAPVLIITTFKAGVSGFEADGNPTNEIGNEWGAYDLGLSNAYMLLKATELGYDSLIMGIRDAEAIRTICEVPEDEHVVAVIAIGKRAKDVSTPPRKAVEAVAKFI